MQKKAIAIIATLDTKGPEAAFVKSGIEREGFTTVVLDTGILGQRDPVGPVPDMVVTGDQCVVDVAHQQHHPLVAISPTGKLDVPP